MQTSIPGQNDEVINSRYIKDITSYNINITNISDDLLEITDEDKNTVTISNKNIIPSDHWHPFEIKYNNMINTLNGEVLSTKISKVDNNTWFVDGKVKYYINYDDDGRWTGLKFNPDEDTVIEYVCISCN